METSDLHNAIKELGLSQAGLAALIGKSERTMRYWLAGETPIDETSRRLIVLIVALTRLGPNVRWSIENVEDVFAGRDPYKPKPAKSKPVMRAG